MSRQICAETRFCRNEPSYKNVEIHGTVLGTVCVVCCGIKFQQFVNQRRFLQTREHLSYSANLNAVLVVFGLGETRLLYIVDAVDGSVLSVTKLPSNTEPMVIPNSKFERSTDSLFHRLSKFVWLKL